MRDGSSEGNLGSTPSTSRRRREAASAALEASKLRANLSSCKYESVREVTKKHGYEEVDDEYEHWDLNWTDLSVSEHRVSKMLPFQRVNHFPGMMEICRKAALSRHLKRMRSVCPTGTYDFAPETWEHPNEMEAFRKHCKAHPGGSYIVKPTAGAMGRGIYLVKGPDAIDHKHESAVVVQKYVSSPFLVDGFKFDLRIYALVTCVDPLTVYVYEEGIARFATTRYQKPTAANLASKTMHLTNYSLNKHSADFVHTETDDEGTKRALSALWKDLRAKGHDVDALWREIRDLVWKTVAPIQPLLAHAYHSATKSDRKPRDVAFGGNAETREVFGARPIGGSVRNAQVISDSYARSYASRIDSSSEKHAAKNTPRSASRREASSDAFGETSGDVSRCFEILGFDVLLDDRLRPRLIEVNHSPSFGMDSPLDRRVKSGLIGDALRALAPDPAARLAWVAEEKRRQKQRLYETFSRRSFLSNACSVMREQKFGERAEKKSVAERHANGDDVSDFSLVRRPSGAEPGSRRDRALTRGESAESEIASLRAQLAAFDVSDSDRESGSSDADSPKTFARRYVAKQRPPGAMSVFCPPERLGGFTRALPFLPSDPDLATKTKTFETIRDAADSSHQPVAGCACSACESAREKSRSARETNAYTSGYAAHQRNASARRVDAAGEAAPLDDRDDAFLSSFPFSRDAPKAFSVGGGDGVTVTYTSLAAKAALVPRNGFARRSGDGRNGAHKTFR